MNALRHATPADAEPIARLWRDVETLHTALLPDIFAPDTFPIPELPVPESEAVLVALDDAGDVCGVRHLLMLDEIAGLRPASRAGGHLIAVASQARRQGLARQLVKAGEEWARGRGATETIVTVWAGNTASRALYISLGYEPVAETLRKPLVNA